jgi:hypothetical protein
MSDKKEYSTQETCDICNGSLRAAIKCDEQGQKPCETCKLMEECKKAKEAIDELWKTKE